ncbi:DUF1538 domain-containing protein [Bradyrhizobium sp. CCBAU 51765]|uniref:DUF1538 domain-containing protein n=1 Tax=Bradyrhizobium sp. CCBAU 51765 TaxID=1325102 RepID=UPI001886AC10|nr:DUF1538 domain-containing protein [Bradyrhizobium sp. CCBAU 51765]QOZ06699.1 DUF1538 domain-containing protein [Bradyrhizobium sp. CCBAU 51765]
MSSELKARLLEVLRTVAPLIGMICVLQVILVQAPMLLFLQFLAGAALVIVGMMLLFMGVDLGILPMGRFIGAELPKKGSVAVIVAVGFAMGFAVTVAEPDVLVLASQVDRISQGGIDGEAVLYVIAVGVAVFVALAMARVVYGASMRLLFTIAFGVVIFLSFVTPAEFVPLAYDAGSVTTGVLTAPVVIALAVGLSSVLSGRSAVSDGFGLLGFASVGPIIAVMIMGMVLR